MDDLAINSKNSVRRVAEQKHYEFIKHEMEHLENQFTRLRNRERAHSFYTIQHLCDEFGLTLKDLEKGIKFRKNRY